MASNLEFIKYVVEQMESAGDITYRKMFGEYALYCDKKVMALVCRNQLFIKPTKAGKSYIKNVVEHPPYPGAKPHFLIEDQLEDRNWISNLIKVTVAELPEPKPRKKPTKKSSRAKSK
jgi:TfoX/Sxy family transcriptional regulator of competence genes